MSVEFYQIYYHDDQFSQLYDFAIPYKNTSFSPYFENAVIADLVPKSMADYVSVCSWALRQKREQGWTPVLLVDTSLTLEKIAKHDFDIAILCPFDPQHKTMECSAHWHGTAWTEAINTLRTFIHVPVELEGNAIYQNHFIARKEIYQSYVSECLAPVISFMEGKEVFTRPSKYETKIIRTKGHQEVNRILSNLSEYYGRKMDDYPIAPFILERLFRIWIDRKPYRIINI